MGRREEVGARAAQARARLDCFMFDFGICVYRTCSRVFKLRAKGLGGHRLSVSVCGAVDTVPYMINMPAVSGE